MKKLILTFGILLAGIVYVNAQDNNGAVTKMINKITAICNLTASQDNQIQSIMTNYMQACQANKSQYANNPGGLQNANKATSKNYMGQIQNVLTTDQKNELKTYYAQRKAAAH